MQSRRILGQISNQAADPQRPFININLGSQSALQLALMAGFGVGFIAGFIVAIIMMLRA